MEDATTPTPGRMLGALHCEAGVVRNTDEEAEKQEPVTCCRETAGTKFRDDETYRPRRLTDHLNRAAPSTQVKPSRTTRDKRHRLKWHVFQRDAWCRHRAAGGAVREKRSLRGKHYSYTFKRFHLRVRFVVIRVVLDGN